MIYLLVSHFLPWLEAHGLGFSRVFTYLEFQCAVALLCGFSVVLATGSPVIGWLRRQKIGDLAGFDHAEMDRLMVGKKGTPTMGGIVIVGAIVVAGVLFADLSSFYVKMALICLLWLCGVGAVDDWLKLTAGRREGGRQGLHGPEKLLFQVSLGVLLGYFTYQHGYHVVPTHTLYFPFFKNAGIVLGLGSFVFLATLVMTSTSNAVNLTDGLDGLAAGTIAIASLAFIPLAVIAGRAQFSYLLLPHIQASDQMAVLAAAMAGACMGFLWFNCNPAQVFMGDTGSLAMGGLLGYLAIVIRQEITLVLVGGIFVLEAVSVLIQRYYFKYTRIRFGQGRRVFLTAPIHHHFQQKGWSEVQVVVRFWLIAAMLAALALATVKLR